jgi:predicted kinase
MPTVKRFHRCRIEMYFGDHNPPHFHIITRQQQRVAVIIETLAVMAGTADKRDTAEAIEWARSHQDLLAARWSIFSEPES